MRIVTIAFAATLTAISVGSAWAQGTAVGTVPAGPVVGTAAGLPGSDRAPGTGPGQRSDKSPGGVIAGTNPNPDADVAGGIRSPGAAVNAPGIAVGR